LNATNASGFYGKLPALGDFVHRRLSRDLIEAIDAWLQQALAQSRNAMDDAWLNAYLISPLWCFALQKGVVSEEAWLGVMMPSVDRVGRYFPFLILQPLPDETNVMQAAQLNSQWFEQAQTLALAGLDDSAFDLDAFDQQVADLSDVLHVEAVPRLASEGKDFGSAWRIGFSSSWERVSVDIANQLMLSRLGSYSVWWTEGSEAVSESFLVCDGLPQAHSYVSMLSGRWEEGLWQNWGDLECGSEVGSEHQNTVPESVEQEEE
jgi:type VI secretion system protein ImpM